MDLYHTSAGEHDDIGIPLMRDQVNNFDPAVAQWAKEFEDIYIKHASAQGRVLDEDHDFVLITCRDFHSPDPTVLDEDEE